jgi:methyl-accepting chemotaxis protein
MASGLLVMSIGMTLVFPVLLPALVLLPILAIVSVLPFVTGRALIIYGSVFASVEVCIIVLGNTVSLLAPPPLIVSVTLTIVAATLIVAVIFVVLWQFHARLGHMLADTQAANAGLAATQVQLEQQLAETQQLRVAEEESRRVLEQAVGDYLVFVERVAGGDLSQRVALTHNGVLGQLGNGLNGMVDKLHTLTSHVHKATTAMAASAAEILAATT